MLDSQEIKKLKTGERWGTAALYFCAAATFYFVLAYSLSLAFSNTVLKIVSLATGPALIVLGAAVAAFCNIKFSAKIERSVNSYVVDVFVENAAKMHPEKKSITYLISVYDDKVEVVANDFKKDVITFDFSAFGKLSMGKKSLVTGAIAKRLCVTYVRLLRRGGEYESVDYVQKDISRNKTGKHAPIIAGGVPDKAALKACKKE